jgi:hypothetical protein
VTQQALPAPTPPSDPHSPTHPLRGETYVHVGFDRSAQVAYLCTPSATRAELSAKDREGDLWETRRPALPYKTAARTDSTSGRCAAI